MLKSIKAATIAATLLVAGVASAEKEITVCVVAKTPKNPVYYMIATSVTRLRCELPGKNYRPTLKDLYKKGWRLISVVGAEHTIKLGNKGPSPLYYLERDKPEEDRRSRRRSGGNGFSLF